MKVAILGGGPAGLYCALLLKRSRPDAAVAVIERNAPDDTFGWGVVFSNQTLENFRAADPETYHSITESFAHWDDIDIHFKGEVITSTGHGFAGIARKQLLAILQQRAQALGVELHFRTEVVGSAELSAQVGFAPDVIVAADGVNSATRRTLTQQLGATIDERSARFIWLGTHKRFHAFTFIVLDTPTGVYQVHAYPFNEGQSAFIVECDEASWRGAGFDRMDAATTVATCEQMFAPWLDGHALEFNATPHRHRDPWVNFGRVNCLKWHHENIVLLGDAAHTAHFSIGSGTKLAMEDAIALAQCLSELGATPSREECTRAFDKYQREREIEVLRIQNAARNSMEWFENVRRYVALEPRQFAYALLTRSQRVSHENLRLRDARYVADLERWFAHRSGASQEPVPPPMFTPFSLRGLQLRNRVVMAPMATYSADEGTPNDFHVVHYGARALGGAGLIITEMTCVCPEARITPGCTGMYTPAHVDGWRRITDFVHEHTDAKICLQLGHSGRKGSTRRGLEGTDIPLESGNWDVVAPSAIPHKPGMQVPRALDRASMDRVVDQFVASTRDAVSANFDMIELHCAHGYLLSSFLTPLANQRTDEYGGSLANRVRFPIEVFRAMRSEWPNDKPFSVRISATDWVAGGVDASASVEIARAFLDAGADIIHVSTGQTSPDAKPVYGRMYQTPYSDRIRNELGAKTIAVGAITEGDQVNSIIMAGRADLCAIGRPHLADPAWTLRAAATLGYRGTPWPWQYRSGGDQLRRLLATSGQG